jgi:predicted CoA-binding protein
MQQGAESDEAVALCREKGIAAVPGQCLMMHTEAGFPHSIHRWLWKMLGRY